MSPDYNFFFFSGTGTRADANIHKTLGCSYVSKYLHGCRRMDPRLPLLRSFLLFVTLPLRDTIGEEGVVECVHVFANDVGCRGGNFIRPFANTGFFLTLVTDTFSIADLISLDS